MLILQATGPNIFYKNLTNNNPKIAYSKREREPVPKWFWVLLGVFCIAVVGYFVVSNLPKNMFASTPKELNKVEKDKEKDTNDKKESEETPKTPQTDAVEEAGKLLERQMKRINKLRLAYKDDASILTKLDDLSDELKAQHDLIYYGFEENEKPDMQKIKEYQNRMKEIATEIDKIGK